MNHTVRTFPGLVTCGKCGRPMRQESLERNAMEARILCFNLNCEQYQVLLKLPSQLLELEKAEA